MWRAGGWREVTFTYDSRGRRVSKTLLSTTAGLVYDGPNPVQELNGTTVTANLLTGGAGAWTDLTARLVVYKRE
jgi:hypothetical protein